jgi:hypothetical protein
MEVKFSRISGIAGLLLLAMVLLVFINQALPIGYWDAIFELGFDPITERKDPVLARERIEKIHTWRALVSDHLQGNEELLEKITEFESRITSMDAGNLYDLVPYSDRHRCWRGVGFRGESNANGYRLHIVNPEIEYWLNPPTEGYAWLGGSQQHFGDMSVRVFIKPVREDIYRFVTEGYFGLDDVPLSNGIRMTLALSEAAWSEILQKRPAPDRSPNTVSENHHRIVSNFATSFPNLFGLISRYFKTEIDLSPSPTSRSEYPIFEIKVGANADAFMKEYPKLGNLLKKMNGMISSRTRIYDEEARMISKVELDWDSDFFTVRFSARERSRVSLPREMQLQRDMVSGGTDQVYRNFHMIHDIHLNLFGLHFDIEEFRVLLGYASKQSAPHLFAQINQPPKAVKAYGRAFGFVPIWLIDLLIPSSLERIIHDFLETLALSNAGKGAQMEAGSMSMGPCKESLWITTAADVSAKGTIKLLFNLQKRLFAEKRALSQEIRSFRNQMWYAFYQDFKKHVPTLDD